VHKPSGSGPTQLDSDLLREAQSLLEDAQSLAYVGSWSAPIGGGVVFSKECRRLFDIAEHEVVDEARIHASIHPLDRARVKEEGQRAIDDGVSRWECEFRVCRKDGSIRWMLARTCIVRDEAGAALRTVGITQDITERKQSIEELRASEERYRRIAAIVEWSNDAIIGGELDGTITSWNRGATRLFGYEESEALQRRVDLILPEGLRVEAAGLLMRVQRGEVVEQHATVRRRKDGTNIEVLLTMSPVRADEGQVVGVSTIARDLTDQRQAESALRRAEQQLREAQKLEAVGLLAGGIAHDFNNMLSVIVGYVELVLESLAPSDPLRSDLLEVRKAGASAVSLTRQLLAFSRRQVLQPRVIDLNQIVLGLERMLRRLMPAHVALTFDLSAELGRVSADPGQIEQVIMNLALNARDAMVSAGTVTILTSNIAVSAAESEALNVPSGPYVVLSVSDTGGGIEQALRARIFEPFFTTKAKGKGTGLGLSTTLGIVRQSGGAVDLSSEVGIGTTFHIYLPRTERPVQATNSSPPAAGKPGGWETVLLVEDEEQVRALARTSLRREGYQVLESEDGEQALDVLHKYTGHIHLLLTDVVMPRMGGRELAARASALRPELKVLFMSGYAHDEVVSDGLAEVEIALLAKPITPSLLGRKVREVLDS
jgi:PAS domain S-box-containing protein